MTNKPFAITLDPASSRSNHTGGWRTERPVYLDRQPPCEAACPAGEHPQDWLYQAEDGGYQAAWQRIVAINPLPAVMGRICYHPCETACNRGQLDTAVGINSVERFLGDEALREDWSLPPAGADTGRRVLVVGAGPAGLSAAYQLRRLGHRVQLRDRAAEPGGMLRYGIPRFRLPAEVMQAEIDRVLALGIELRLRAEVTDLAALLDRGEFDAAFVGVGAQLSHRTYLPAVGSARVLDALHLLADVDGGARPELGRRVAIYGGGNTAMDAARTARRLGAAEAVVIYRRNMAHMPADPIEVTQAVDEGVRMRWLSTIADVDPAGITVERMRLDADGAPVGTGELETMPADAVILAIGEDVDHRLLDGLPDVAFADGRVQVSADQATGRRGIWAGGDVTGRGGSVTAAIGHGRRAARAIDAWLAQRRDQAEPERPPAAFDRLNTWYFSDAPRTVQPVLDAARRTSGFEEVVAGLTADNALFEARRCLSCGNCFGCDNCYGVCPDNAVLKVSEGHGYAIDLDYCKGCGLCVSECPAGAITMVPEQT
ncbi:MAG TPA: NAD(P)-binding protein [Jatrophihabitans sp.]|nr:NAD(P)-binding protein [Jatrophihabitans sp.]